MQTFFCLSHLPQRWVPLLNAFNQTRLTPYLSFHRLCFSPEIWKDPKGKAHKISRYETMMAPHAKLESRPRAE